MSTNTAIRKHELVDQLFELKEKRSGVAKIAADYKAQQEAIELELIEIMETEGASAVSSEAGTLTLTMSAAPAVVDFAALKRHIEENPQDRLDLLERRVSKSGCRERWQAGESVPGVEQKVEASLSYRVAKATV